MPFPGSTLYPGGDVYPTGQPVLPSGIPSGEAFGSPRVVAAGRIDFAGGIASAEAFGSPTARYNQTVGPVGGLGPETFGTLRVVHLVDVGYTFGTGLHPDETVYPGETLYPDEGIGGGIPSAEAFGTPTDIRARDTRWHLVSPHRVDRYRERVGRAFQYVTIVSPFTVYGDDLVLNVEESPTAEAITAAKYVWLGGHQNTTTSAAIRNLWAANGFGIEAEYLD